MSVSNLTGTKWVLPYDIETQDISVVAGQDFDINFTSLNTNFAQLRFGDFSSRVYKYLSYDNYEVWNYDDEWLAGGNERNRLISITGGNDVSNPDLLAWLNNNATLQPITPTKTFDLSTLQLSAGTHEIKVRARAQNYRDSNFSNSVNYEAQLRNLTGTKWVITGNGMTNVPTQPYYCNTVYQVSSATYPYYVYSGKCFKIGCKVYEQRNPQYVNTFYGLGRNYYTDQRSNIPSFPFTGGEYMNELYFVRSSSTIFTESNKTSYDIAGISTYNQRTSLVVEFTGGDDATNADLIAWLEAKATRLE